jgi:hypothetical protein
MITFSCVAWKPEWLEGRWATLVQAWRAEFAPKRLTGCFGVCIAVFLYAMSWRFIYPDIDGSSEKIADFSYICSYYTGATLPVQDAWFSPYLSTQYYSFQHYGAALMGRILLLPPGSAYNIGYCLLIALGGTAFAGAVFMVARNAWTRAAVITCFVVGGTGVTILDHFTDKEVTPWTNMRYIGSAQMDKEPLGKALRAYNYKYIMPEGTNNSFVMELPGEIYSYVVFLGDYHAPLSGYYLLGLCAMGMLLWTRSRLARYPAIVGATLTWTLLANTWVLPLQGLAIFLWLATTGATGGSSCPRSPGAPPPSGSPPGSTSPRSRRRPRATTRPSASCPGSSTPPSPLHPLLPADDRLHHPRLLLRARRRGGASRSCGSRSSSSRNTSTWTTSTRATSTASTRRSSGGPGSWRGR